MGILVLSSFQLIGAARGEAQTALRYGANVTWSSRYEWRGTTRRGGYVMQPDMFIGLGRDKWLAAGVWTYIELDAPGLGTSDLGYGRRWFGEINLWAEGSVPLGPWRFTLGGVRYWLRPDSDSTALYTLKSTHEAYARAALFDLGRWVPALSRLVPQVTVFHDFGQVHGAYAEGAMTIQVPLWAGVLAPLHSLLITGTFGYNFGQHADVRAPNDTWYFRERGLTHVDLSAGFTFGALTAYLHPEVHFQIGRDPNTKIGRIGVAASKTRQFWFRVGVAVTGPRCRPARQLCR